MAQSIPAKVCAMPGTPKSMIKARTHKHQINNEKSNSLLSCYGHWRSAAFSERKVVPVERDVPERQRNDGGDRSSRPTTIRQSLGLDFHKRLCRPTVHHHQEGGLRYHPAPSRPGRQRRLLILMWNMGRSHRRNQTRLGEPQASHTLNQLRHTQHLRVRRNVGYEFLRDV